ncbi:putative bifunctional diguanylate cyclase/phosphodiesterase [Simiduia aestuariiviva]|uniref:Diguanylate cyclase (GGDEF)-like protein n=1 Tax=Simiduia aestuariiviva TaxID=1510459 RepID=A0A839UM56_9GAMM|nr:EAL domain-containing protein [Simiduia aestuariiviva]MBB3167640.1 diguanylate cyclase (GGDEF)-like protein [Simiduia aestuariiviva]
MNASESDSSAADCLDHHRQVLLSLMSNADIGSAVLSDSGNLISANPTLQRWAGIAPSTQDLPFHQGIMSLQKSLRSFKARKSLLHLLFEFQINRVGLKHPLEAQGILTRTKQIASQHEYGLICWLKPRTKPTDKAAINTALDKLLYTVPIGIISINGDWECEFINEEFCLLTERTETELAGRNWTSIFAHHNDRLQTLVTQVTLKGAARIEIVVDHPGRRKKTLELDFKAHLNPDGSLNHGVGALVDVSDRVERQNDIHRLANFDPVTGLHNRLSIQHQLERYIEIAQKLKQPIQLLFIDLDSFKIINDLYGHQVGDKLLKEVGQRITACVRESDIVSRFGGDEFLLLIPGNIDHATVDNIAENILEKVSLSYLIEGLTLHTTASIGIADYSPLFNDNNTPCASPQLIMDDIIQRADITLYSAKQNGKNRFARFTSGNTQKITELYNILQRLPDGIANCEFSMNYQPIIHARTGKLVAIEALIRWHNKDLGWIPPDKFIHIAEAHGKITQVQYCMLNCVCQDLQEIKLKLPQTDCPIRTAINLSGSQIADIEHLNQYLSTLENQGLSPTEITLEITENMLVGDAKEIVEYLNELIHRGYAIALDDFGTGYSSLSYLARIPISTVKLDKSFIDPIENNKAQMSLVSGVLQLAHSLGLKVVAEGVEHASQRNLLIDMGCDYIQGYLIAKPMAPEELIKWISLQNE